LVPVRVLNPLRIMMTRLNYFPKK